MMSYARFRILILLAVLASLGLFAHGAQAQQYNRFGPANGILVGQTTTPQTTAAASSNVISLWSGTCNSTTFLRGDGSCQTPATVTGANPTATIGAAAVNGVATTFMRSDAAPALPATLPALSGANLTSLNAGNISTGTLAVARGGIGIGTLTGIAKGNGTSAFTAAASADVISLWSGTCNSTTFLRGDGSCQTPVGVSGADPTATIGLTAVNGSAGTFLRSDGAPALSQAIVPTWTGQHTFTAFSQIFSNTVPQLRMFETDAGADAGNWLVRSNAGSFGVSTATDAAPTTVVDTALAFARTGTTVDSATLAATAINLTGAVASNGQIQSTSSGAATANSGFYANANAPFIRWREADQSADARDWLFGSSAGVLQLSAVTDAGTAPPNGGLAFQATRTAGTVTAINFGNNTANPTFTWTGSGTWSVGGGIGSAGQVLTSNGAGVAPTWTTVSSGASGANPTATIGLTAVNGSAGTFLRSDGAPALSQAIAPTWTAKHIFAQSGNLGTNAVGASVDSSFPVLQITETDQAANNQRWAIVGDVTNLGISALTDAGAESRAMTFARSGGTATNIASNVEHIFNATNTVSGVYAIEASSSEPGILISETGVTTNNSRWDMRGTSEILVMRAVSDDYLSAGHWLNVDRTGTTIDSVNLQGTSVQVNGIAIGNNNINVSHTTSGFSSLTTDRVDWVRNGRQVCLFIQILGTSNATTFTVSGGNWPTSAYGTDAIGMVRVADSGTGVTGRVTLDTGGAGTFTVNDEPNAVGGGFTASGTKSALGSVCYLTN